MRIEIVYADEHRRLSRVIRAQPPLSVEAALAIIAMDPQWVGIDWAAAGIGVFGRVVTRDRILCDGERLEIYAALKFDPKTARRQRALKKSAR